MKSLKGLRFDNGPAKCVDIGTFDCSHHCSTEDCVFANKTINALGPGGGALIPGVHTNQGGRPGYGIGVICRLETYIGNKLDWKHFFRLETIVLDWKQKKDIGNNNFRLETKSLDWKHKN